MTQTLCVLVIFHFPGPGAPASELVPAHATTSVLQLCKAQVYTAAGTRQFFSPTPRTSPPPPNLAQQTGSVVISVPSGAVQNGWEHRFDPKRIPPAADPFAPRLQSHSCCTRFNVGHEDVYSLFMRVSFRAKPRTF